MDELLFLITTVFSRGGFTVEPERSGIELWKRGDVRYAIPKIKRIGASEGVSGRGQYLGCEVTVDAEVRCYGTDCGYADGDHLRDLIGGVGQILLLMHGKNVKWISSGEVVRDPVTGRNVITVTLELKGYEDVEVESDEQ